VREEWKTEYAGREYVSKKMTTNYTKWLTNDELDKEWTKLRRCIENGLRRIMEG
jgi:hypothetical protein